MQALVANWREWRPIHGPTLSLTDPEAYLPGPSHRTHPHRSHRTVMDIDDNPRTTGSVTLPAIAVAEASPSKRPAPLKLKDKETTLPSIGDLFDGVNVTTPFSPFTRLVRNFGGELTARSPLFPSPLRSPSGLGVPSFALQPATPVVGQSVAGADAATYVPTEQLVNNDFEIDPALTEASTPLNTPPEVSETFSLPITPAKDMQRYGKISSERNVLRDTSPGRSYSSNSPHTSPYRHMTDRWDPRSIAPAQISRSPSPSPMRDDSDDEPAGHMEMDSPANGATWQQPVVALPQTGYFAPHFSQGSTYTSQTANLGMLAPHNNYYATPSSTPEWPRAAPSTPICEPSTPPRQIRTSPAAYAHSAPTVPYYVHPTPYASPGAELATSLENTVPPGVTFDQWSGLNPATYMDNLHAGSWSEGRNRLASPAYSEMSIDASPSPARVSLPYTQDYRNSFTQNPSPSPSPAPSMVPLPTGAGPVRPGTVHGRARHNPVPRRRSTTGVALNQFSQLTHHLIYPAYDGAIRQWSPVLIDQINPVPHEYRDKRGFWDENCFWTWDSSVKVHTRCIRICAQCHTDRPGAKTWRRSHIQQDTSLCNKCGIYEHTHEQPRPHRAGDAEKGYNPARRLETFNLMMTSRVRGPKRDRSPSPPLKLPSNPVFGGVIKRKDDNPKPFPGVYRTRKGKEGDEDEYRPGR